MLDVKDRLGCITKAEMREYFEQIIADTPVFKDTPLGIMEVNGEFKYYTNSTTDTMWLGFALGMRIAERLKCNRETLLKSPTSLTIGINKEMLLVLKDIARVTNMTSRASHAEQTAIFQRMRKVIADADIEDAILRR